MWVYQDQPFTQEMADGYHSFVYLITNKQDGRVYVGKKQFVTTRKKKVAGKSRRKTTTKVSDWESYWSSSEELQEDVKRLGQSSFKREIIRLCTTKSEASYYECKYQIGMDLMLRQERTYNRWILVRLRPFKVVPKKS